MGDLRAILAHQLATPLGEEMDEFAKAGECTREAVLKSIEAFRCRTFGELLHLEAPLLEMLRLVKDYAKAHHCNEGRPLAD